MGDCMNFNDNPMDFIKDYSFRDTKEIYTNGSELISVFIVEQMMNHYMPRWIPVTERLPEAGKRYLVSALWKDEDFEVRRTYDAVYGSDGVWHTHNYEPMTCKVIAWMPLPEPYEEENYDKACNML